MPIHNYILALVLFQGAFLHRNAVHAIDSIDQGYDCDGMIIKKDPSNNSVEADNLICCQGDPKGGVLLGQGSPTSCTAGTAIPLTQAPKAGSGGSSPTTAT